MQGCREVKSEGAGRFGSGQTDTQRSWKEGRKERLVRRGGKGRILKQTSPFPDHPSKKGRDKHSGFIYGGMEARRARQRHFRILHHLHGDRSPGNRVHNGCGIPGNSASLAGEDAEAGGEGDR